ncbi:MAG TPA: glycosyltransferase family 87 protein [Candidatus Dormibacteraeota bacterium]
MTETSRRWRNLGAAAGAVTATLFAIFDLYQWAVAYASDHFHNDFTFYYAAAKIGLANGWPSIYDLSLQQQQLDMLGSGITVAELARYISPPPVAWVAAPLTALPYPVAYWAWSALLIAALVGTWYLAAPGPGRTRVIYLAAAVAWLPVIYGLQLAQPGMLVALGVAGSYALLRADRPLLAGVALGTLALKPQLAFLAPLALLAARRDRAFLGSVLALGVLAAISVLALGGPGLSAYEARLNFAASVPVNRELTLAFLVGDAARPAQVLIGIWTLVLAYRLRHRGVEWTYVCALVGGMLATPYVHLDDLAMLGLAAWLCLRAKPPAWTWIYLLAGVVAVEGEPIWGPVPVLAAELAAVVLLSVAAFTFRDALTLPQIDARPLELRPKR